MKKKVLPVLADLRFAIFILWIIILCSIIGTVIEQDQSIEFYKANYPLTHSVFGILNWNQILQFGLDHIYKTWWFLILIFLFGLSLISCTFFQQFPSLKIARRCQFFRTTNQFYKVKISTILDNFSFKKIISKLKKIKYSIFQQKNILYCYKGLIGRIAPIIVHLSMILILIGTIISSFFGFKGQEIVPKTESFHIQRIINTGQLTHLPSISLRINDFWITYTKNKTISQFYSDISILNNQGNENYRKTISVNHPLIDNGIYYYQTDWNLIGLRFQNLTNQIIDYPLQNILNNQNKIWISWISENSSFDKGVITILDNLEGYCSIYNQVGQFLGNIELNETISQKRSLILKDIISSTGLQIKTDPGIPIIYIGFLFLILSTLISYITYSQIWIIKKNQKIFIGGNTNRAIFEFEIEFFKFVK